MLPNASPQSGRRRFLAAAGAAAFAKAPAILRAASARRPNILFAISDDHSYPHTSAMGDKVVKTPAFDRVAASGVLFRNAYCLSPGCAPSRAGLLTGRYPWQIEEAGTHASFFPKKFSVYPDILEKNGYFVGLTGKGAGPCNYQGSGWTRNPAGPSFDTRKLARPLPGISANDYSGNFADFLKARPKDKPFCFWYGCTEPHRGYDKGSGIKSGKKLDDVVVPPFLPDSPEVRSDILDYYFEVERFDRDVGAMLKLLEERGELDNTLVVVTSDNGWPFPRGKATCYDAGTLMPLAIRWPAKVKGGRVIDDFVSHTDLAPTFLEAAGVKVPSETTGKSLMSLLTSGRDGQVEPWRDKIFFGRERHASVRAGNVGYPTRGIRTADFLFLRNFAPERWPAGDPPLYGDVDQHLNIEGSPSKQAVVEHGDKPDRRRLFDLSFSKRPAEELFDLKADPWQTSNVAGDVRYLEIQKRLRADLDRTLSETKDPRALGTGADFDRYHYVTGAGQSRPKRN